MIFRAKLGGDGECFCFLVDKETYIKIKGESRYLEEVAYLREAHEERYQYQTYGSDVPLEKEKFVEPLEWQIYPSDVLGIDYDRNMFYEIELTKNPIDTYTI